jgi:phage-related baseplate assembly protein
MIDLSQLPPPEIVDALDYETILADRKARLIALTPAENQAAITATLALESEPIVKLLQENAYRELLLRQRINEACHAVMLAYAINADLDNIAAHWDVSRLFVDAGDLNAVPPIPPTYESDTRLRFRTQLAMEGLTVAGSRGAYQFHALTSSARVLDCSVIGPELIWVDGVATSDNGIPPGMVNVYILDTLHNGVPDAGLLAAVYDYLSAETRRPLCDSVTVLPGEIIEYAVVATLYIYPGPSEAPVLAKALEDTQSFTSANFRLGYDVRRSALFAKLHAPGTQRVELTSPPEDLVIAANQAARCTSVTITLGGRDV